MKQKYAIWIVDDEKDNYQKITSGYSEHAARDVAKGKRLSTGIPYEYVLEGGMYEEALTRLHNKYEEIARLNRAYVREQWTKAQDLIRDTPMVIHAVPCTAEDGTEYTGYEIEDEKQYLGFSDIDNLVSAVKQYLERGEEQHG